MKVAIIGGGACGLVVANILAENKIQYEIFERSSCGKKILASGNGKANIANIHLPKNAYNQSYAYDLVKKYQEKLFEFFEKIHLVTKVDDEGRIYPYSESSLTVLNCLLNNNLNITENFPITKINKINNQYYLNDVRGPFDYIVLASGSMASFIKKKRENFNDYLNFLTIHTTKLYPSLVGFKLDCNWHRLAGVRLKCVAKLCQNEEVIYEEAGEVILKNDGISGICILNLSAIYNRLKVKDNCYISLDLIPNLKLKINSLDELMGLVNPKLFDYLKDYSIEKINDLLHHFTFKIIEPYDFEFAQVVSGGIKLEDVCDNLSLKDNNHLFVGGEILDVDGLCGGYNLMFAFCCGLLIGEELCNIK